MAEGKTQREPIELPLAKGFSGSWSCPAPSAGPLISREKLWKGRVALQKDPFTWIGRTLEDLKQAECRNRETVGNTRYHIHAITFGLVLVGFIVSPPYGIVTDGFHLHVLDQSFNAKPSNFVKKEKKKKKRKTVTPETK